VWAYLPAPAPHTSSSEEEGRDGARGRCIVVLSSARAINSRGGIKRKEECGKLVPEQKKRRIESVEEEEEEEEVGQSTSAAARLSEWEGRKSSYKIARSVRFEELESAREVESRYEQRGIVKEMVRRGKTLES
jgi:hypothetical protein